MKISPTLRLVIVALGSFHASAADKPLREQVRDVGETIVDKTKDAAKGTARALERAGEKTAEVARDAADSTREAMRDTGRAVDRAADRTAEVSRDVARGTADAVDRARDRTVYVTRESWYDARGFLREEPVVYRKGLVQHLGDLGADLRYLETQLETPTVPVPNYFLLRMQALKEQFRILNDDLVLLQDDQIADVNASRRTSFNWSLYYFEYALRQAEAEASTWVSK